MTIIKWEILDADAHEQSCSICGARIQVGKDYYHPNSKFLYNNQDIMRKISKTWKIENPVADFVVCDTINDNHPAYDCLRKTSLFLSGKAPGPFLKRNFRVINGGK